MEWICPKCGYSFNKLSFHKCSNPSKSQYDAIFSAIEKEEANEPGEHPDNSQNVNLYYEVLELKPNASKEEIMRAYKNLITVWNPTHFNDNPQLQQIAEEKIKRFDEAYEKLILHLSMKRNKTKELSDEEQKDHELDEQTNEPINMPTTGQSQKKNSDNLITTIGGGTFLALIVSKILSANDIHLGFIPAILLWYACYWVVKSIIDKYQKL
jgi:sugar-specific transcriptional regulator TrmB